MNKKQIAVTGLLISLMLLLVITQHFFVNNFSKVNLMEGDEKYIECSFEDYSIKLPSEWVINEEEKKGEYISYNIKFNSKDNIITGLVQVINTNQDIKDFAEKDTKNQLLEYSNNEITPFENYESVGVLSKYNTNINNGYSYMNECYYIKGMNGQMIKVLFNIQDDKYSKDFNKECQGIISSIKQGK